MSVIPRIRGKVGQATEPADVAGKWFFEMWLSQMGEGEGDSLGMFGPFDTEEQAQAELRNACQLACEAIEKKMTGEISGHYIDMKSNELKKWENQK